MKILEKKTKHHYVWAHYLREWTLDGSNIFYITKNNKIACDSVRGLGYEKNFYKMSLLQEEDKEIILMITKECNDNLRKTHLNFVNMIYDAQNIFSSISAVTQSKIGVNITELMQHNLFEDYLSQQESKMVKALQELKNGNLSYLEDKGNFYEFTYFLGYQFSRTLKIKSLLTMSLEKISADLEVKEKLKNFYDRHWWFMCSFMATNLSYGMALCKSKKISIINNDTSLDFITSDHPVINLNPQGHLGELVDYYYPLSPRKAIIILASNNKYFENSKINDNDVKFLNSQIVSNSCKTLFSNSLENIEMYSTLFKSRHYLHFSK
jgi:hypothetical protein